VRRELVGFLSYIVINAEYFVNDNDPRPRAITARRDGEITGDIPLR
jgi:hypothetical protein